MNVLGLKMKKKIILELKNLKKCNSKIRFKNFITKCSEEIKQILRLYLKKFFYFDLYSRNIKDKVILLKNRKLFYEIIKNPNLLILECNFANNSIKNLLTGASNFIFQNLKYFLRHVKKSNATKYKEN